jgi:O-antigen ligase
VQFSRWADVATAGWNGYPYVYPFTLVAVVGVVGCVRWLRDVPLRRWPFPLFFVLAYVSWALLSAVWTASPNTTAVRAVTGVGIAAFGCWFGGRLRGAEQIWAVATAACSAAVMSALVVWLQPQYGKMPARGTNTPGGEWQGIFGNRNGLAPVCVMGLVGLAAVVALRPSWRRAGIAGAFAVLQLALLRGSGGMTSLLALGFALVVAALVPAVWVLRRRGVNGWAVAGALVAVMTAIWTYIFVNLDRLAEQVGRDPTLSKRRWIWDDARQAIQVHPARGYGFWAFWERPDLTEATYARHGAAYGSAHNSVLEVTLGLGGIGLTFYLAIGITAITGIAMWVWRGPSVAAWFWALLLTFVLTQNLMESFVLWHSYNWILFVAAAVVAFGVAGAEPLGRTRSATGRRLLSR